MKKLIPFISLILVSCGGAVGNTEEPLPSQINYEVAYFAGGCFWCMEPPFEKLKGVKKILNNEDSLKLDEIADKSIRTENLRNKLLKISNKLKELKNGKKNTR